MGDRERRAAFAAVVIGIMGAGALALGLYFDGDVLFEEDLRWVLKHALVLTFGMLGWAAVFFPVSLAIRKLVGRCIFGHDQKYVAIVERRGFCELHGQYNSRWHTESNYQVARWVCDRPGCTAMGERCLGETRYGVWTVMHGKIDQDEKKWANS